MPWMEQARHLLRRAHEDDTALRKLAVDPEITDAQVGFFAQQACEKGLKAVLAALGIAYPRTHNLRVLRDIIIDSGTHIPNDVDSSLILSPYAAQFRYDDPPEGGFDRAEAIRIVAGVLTWCDAQIAEAEAKA